jgi:hypothetical protein
LPRGGHLDGGTAFAAKLNSVSLTPYVNRAIHVRLSLKRLDETAASLVIGGNHFGFDGQGKKLFVEGPALSWTRLLADSQTFITPGRPSIDPCITNWRVLPASRWSASIISHASRNSVEVVRRGGTLSFRIDGGEVHTGDYRLPTVCAIGLRPWRGTMRLSDFSASGDLTAVTETATSAIQHDFRAVNAVTVGGVKIDPAILDGGRAAS